MKKIKIRELSVMMVYIIGFIFLLGCSIAQSTEVIKDGNENANDNEYFVNSENQNLEKIEIHFDHYIFENIDDMVDFATDIIWGEVLEQRTELIDVSMPWSAIEAALLQDPYFNDEEIANWKSSFEQVPEYEVITTYRIKVLDVFQGNLNVGDIIEVWRTGGEYEGAYWFVSDAVRLESNRDYVMFLFENFGDRPFAFAGHSQSVYFAPFEFELNANNLAEYGSMILDVELESVIKTHSLLATVEDLIEIAKYNDLLD